MYDPPSYLWAITIAGIIAIPAATCIVLYGGALRAGQSQARAALLGGGAAVVFGGWFTASAVIAGHGWYHAQLGHQVPWLPIVVVGFLGLLLALRRIPAVARALAAPGMVNRLELPHSFRVIEGTAFVLMMALGHLPALFALPAGLGDIAAGIAAPLVALRLAHGRGRRAALWFNAFGMTDLVTPWPSARSPVPAGQRHSVRRADQRAAPRADPDAAVPLLFALHITSVSALLRAPRTPLRATAPSTAAENSASARLYAGRRPGQRKGNAMNTRSPYPDVEIPEISQPRFVLDRADERGAAVPLMGPAAPATVTPLMGPAAPATVTPLLGPADPATVTPLLGPADRGTMVSLMGPADPGTATPLMLPSR